MAETAVILSLGMISAVGVGAQQTASSVRAGISGFCESAISYKGSEPIVMASLEDKYLPPVADALESKPELTSRQSRMLRLAASALAEVSENIDTTKDIPLFVGLPKAWPGETKPAEDHFFEYLAIQSDISFDVSGSRCFAQGRAAGGIALHEALQCLKAGAARSVIVGGVDSYHDLHVMDRLIAEDRILTEGVDDGFVPGEGAAFLLLSSEKETDWQGLKPLASVLASATGFEAGHLYHSEHPYKGEGLSDTITRLFESQPLDPTIKTVYSAMNGEHHWTKEWGVSFTRAQQYIEHDHHFEHPVDCFGDVGAAFAPMMIGLMIHALDKNYRKGPALVYASSDRGDRAAVIIQAYNKEP